MYDNEDFLYIAFDDDLFPIEDESCGDTTSQTPPA